MRKFRNFLASVSITVVWAGASFAQPNAIPTPVQAGRALAQSSPPISPLIANIDPTDLRDWRAAELADTPESYVGYLRLHPNGWFKDMVSHRVGPWAGAAPPSQQRRRNLSRSRDNALWEAAKATNSHAAMRNYLLTTKNGIHVEEAAARYMATMAPTPAGRPQDCQPDDYQLKQTRNFRVQNAYPSQAISTGLGTTAFGEILVDRSGLILAFLNTGFSQTRFFPASIENEVFEMRFAPLKAGCLEGLPFYPLFTAFRVSDKVLRAHRFTPLEIETTLQLGVKTQLALPADSAIRVGVPNLDGMTIYKVQANSRFQLSITYSENGSDYMTLASDGTFASRRGGVTYLRISGPEYYVNTPQGLLSQDWNASGPVEIEVVPLLSRTFNAPYRPPPRVIIPLASPPTPLPTP